MRPVILVVVLWALGGGPSPSGLLARQAVPSPAGSPAARSPAVGSAAPAPWVGTWAQNPAKSTVRPGPPAYKRTTLRIEPVGDQPLGASDPARLNVAYDMVGTRGGRTHIEWTGALDGRDYAVQGVDYVLTNAYRAIDEQTYEITVKLDGQVVATTLVTVSPDGQTLTAVTSERDADGQPVMATTVYDRQ